MATTPTAAAFSITLDCRLDNVPGTLGRLALAIGEAGGKPMKPSGGAPQRNQRASRPSAESSESPLRRQSALPARTTSR